MRVAFTPIGGDNWTGGYHYLKNLLTALSVGDSRAIVPVVLCGPDVSLEMAATLAAIPGVELHAVPVASSIEDGWRLMRTLVVGRDSFMYALVRKFNVDAVFESARFYGWRFGVPAIAWIPDFQHRRLPDQFSFRNYWRRELGFRAQIAAGRTLMFSSQDSMNFCQEHYPVSSPQLALARFSVPALQAPNPDAARAVADRYGLPQHYFFMPNQFWRHKNHLLVLDALALLKKRGSPVFIVASGRQVDPRHPHHFALVEAKIAELHLAEHIRLLGLIPHSDVYSLMCASDAVVNPSLSEGWSTSVEEARAMGVPVVLSDLNVHKEQVGDAATYFDRHSALSLAEALHQFAPSGVTVRRKMAEVARVDAQTRVIRFATDFEEVVRQAIATTRN